MLYQSQKAISGSAKQEKQNKLETSIEYGESVESITVFVNDCT